MSYTNIEKRDMLFVYGFTNGNASEAVREYRRRFPNRRTPFRATFEETYRRAGEINWNQRPLPRERVLRENHNPNEVAVLQAVEAEPTASTRRIGAALRISKSGVHRILKREGLHPYHFTPVQNLLPLDTASRSDFCRWYLRQIQEWGTDRILWTDEASFSRHGPFNYHNSHVWSRANPHVVHEAHFQHEFRVNVWLGITRHEMFGPIIIPDRLNAAAFHQLLENEFMDLFEELPLLRRRQLWFQMDGCPAHNAAVVREWMNQHFEGQWIGRYGHKSWPARSPDLTPLDFHVWGTIKDFVYATPVENIDDLIGKIHQACNRMRHRRNLQKVIDSLPRRYQLCIDQNGGHFEQLL